MGNNKGHLILVIANVALVVVTALLAFSSWQASKQANSTAIQANTIAEQAKKAAETANQMFYQSQQPVITAIARTNGVPDLESETVTVTCDRYPLNYQSINLNTYIEIKTIPLNETGTIYLFLYDYFVIQLTGKQQDVILTGYKLNNVSNFQRIKNEFMDAAREYGLNMYIGKRDIVKINFIDFMGKSETRYYEAGYSSQLMSNDEAESIDKQGTTNYLSAGREGVILSLDQFNGTDLWRWYIKNSLQKKSS